nr:putative ribonuclease H-like domain-containing protein [Tanacetum cinerariifolium]
MSRCLQPKETFTATKKCSMTITDYGQTLKNIADALSDVDSPISETELVMQILRHLPPSYNSIKDIITNANPFPSFIDAHNMFLLHESRDEQAKPSSDPVLNSSTALYTSTTTRSNNEKGKNKSNKNGGNNRGAPRRVTNCGDAGKSSSTVSSFASSGHVPANGSSQVLPSPQQQPSPPSLPPPMYGAPLYYGVQPPQYGPYAPQFGGYAAHFGGYVAAPPRPPFGYQQQPTDLVSVFSSMSLQQPPQYDPQQYMDTSANSHMSFNSGNFTYLTPSNNSRSIMVGNGAVILVSVEFDPFGFTVKDFNTGAFLQRCNSTGDLYPVLPSSSSSSQDVAALAISSDTWHRLLVYGFFPTFNHLRVFGCLCYPNLSATSEHKLALRSTACVYLGLSADHRGSRCYDLITHKVIISRHVRFDESYFPYSSFYSKPSSSEYEIFGFQKSPHVPHGFEPLPPSTQNAQTTQHTSCDTGSSSSDVADSSSPQNVGSPTHASASGLSNFMKLDSVSPPNMSPSVEPIKTHPMVTRLQTGSLKQVDRLNLLATNVPSPIPRSTAQAMCDFNWKAAMDSEMSALLSNHTWDLVSCPYHANVVGCRWLYRHKFNTLGNLERYKGRLVAQGFSQQPGIDFDETFSPVVKSATIRVVLTIAVSRHWPIHQIDVKNAFLNGDLTEEVYMKQPPGYINIAFPPHMCRLHKALYGLKQVSRTWYRRFSVYVTSFGFRRSKSDTSLFTYHLGQDIIYLLLYVDDIIMMASSTNLVQRVVSRLSSKFAMTNLGSLSYFLGISATRSSSGLFLAQSTFAREIISRAGMDNCNPCRTPVDTKSKLSSLGTPVSDPTLYRSLAGTLQYLTFTRPDIHYAVQQVCLFMHDPREPHINSLKRILRYLQGTLSLGLFIRPSSVDHLISYTNAYWAGCPETRRSTFGFCVFLGNNLVSWSSKRQHVVSRSSAEAEYRGVANVVAESAWLCNLLLEFFCPLFRATVVFCDNISALYIASNPLQHQRTKHIEIDLHFVRERVGFGHVRVLHVPSAHQFVDIFTKGLRSQLFFEFRSSLSIRDPPARTAGGVLKSYQSRYIKWLDILEDFIDGVWIFEHAREDYVGLRQEAIELQEYSNAKLNRVT